MNAHHYILTEILHNESFAVIDQLLDSLIFQSYVDVQSKNTHYI